MAQKRTRRRFTHEFKAQAVKRLPGGGGGLSEMAAELGVGTCAAERLATEYMARARPRRWRGAARSRWRRSGSSAR
jgi:transposase-like protein